MGSTQGREATEAQGTPSPFPLAPPGLSAWMPYAALLPVLLVAIYLRFTGLTWDGLQHTHPDERFINWVATTVGLTDNPADWLHPTRSALNPFYWPAEKHTSGVTVPLGEPRRFAYGHFPLYLMAAATHVLGKIGHVAPALASVPVVSDLVNAPGRIEFDHVTLVGRGISAFADSLSVLLVYFVGRRVFGPWTGVLAAAMNAVAVLHVQLAHFGTFDALLTTCVLAALWFAVRFVQGGRGFNLALAGACAGLAVGSKASAALLAAPLGLALVVPNRQAGKRVLRLGFFAATTAVLVFALTNPFALIQFDEYRFNVTTQSKMVRGLFDWFFVQQYRDTTPYLYFADQQARWFLGPPLATAAYAGLAWAVLGLGRALPRRKLDGAARGLLVLLAWVAPFYAITGAFVVKFPRYLLPVTPLLILFGAGLLTAIVRRRRVVGAALISLTVLPTAFYAFAFVNMYQEEHPWISASRWVYQHAPPESRLALERWDDPLPANSRGGVRFNREETYSVSTLDPFEQPDDEPKITKLLDALSNSDYLVIASNRMYGVAPRFPERFPSTTAYYRSLFQGDIGFALAYSVTRAPSIAGVAFVDDPVKSSGLQLAAAPQNGPWTVNLGFADESFTVYDHPRVFVFENVGRLSPAQMRARIMENSVRRYNTHH